MIALGSDHGGFALKQEIIKHLEEQGIAYRDFGCYDESSVHYPIYAKEVAKAILAGECEKGILVCSTGLGISMAANRFAGIRAAVCTDTFCAKMTRLHNNANVLCLGGLVVGKGLAMDIVDTFLTTEFSNGERHIQRIQMIEND